MNHPHHRPLLALVLRTGAAVMIATMFMLGKFAGEHHVALPEIMFWRQFVSLPLLLGWLIWHRGLARLRTTRLKSHFLRAFTGMTGMAFNFAAALLLHLSESTTLNFTAPLFAAFADARTPFPRPVFLVVAVFSFDRRRCVGHDRRVFCG